MTSDTPIKTDMKIEMDVAEDCSLFWTAKHNSQELKTAEKILKHELSNEAMTSRDKSLEEEVRCMLVSDRDTANTVADLIVIKDECVDSQISGSSMQDADTAHGVCAKEEEEELTGRQTPVIVKIEEVDEERQSWTADSKMSVSPSQGSMKTEAEGYRSFHRDGKQPSGKLDPEVKMNISSVRSDPEMVSNVGGGVKRSSTGISQEENQHSQVLMIGIKKEKTEELGEMSPSYGIDTFCPIDRDAKSDGGLDFLVHFENSVKQETESAAPFTVSDATDNIWHLTEHRVGSVQLTALSMDLSPELQQERESSVGRGMSSFTPYEGAATSVPSPVKKVIRVNRYGSLVCPDCKRTFKRPHNLKKHMRRHGEQHVCPECNKTFSRADNLRVHLRQHAGEKLFVCQQCSAAFITSSQLKVHMRSHTGEKPFSCPECSAAFPTTSALKNHRRKHLEQRPYSCKECSATFKHRCCYTAHMSRHTEGERFSCTDCSSVFYTSWQLLAHCRKSHLKEKPFACNECEAVYGMRCQLKVHMRKHSGEKPFSCTVCEAAFFTTAQLRAHMCKHTGEKPYVCTECNKTFTTCGHLRVHKRLHSGQKPFACSVCGVVFATSSHLKVHVRKHTGQKPYTCPDCGAAYMTSSHLKSHMRTHAVPQEFPCTECNAVFKRADLLKSHMTMHTVQKHLTCSECSATFNRAWNYKVHLRIHTGEKPYSCTECPAAFSDPSAMRKHKRRHAESKKVKKMIRPETSDGKTTSRDRLGKVEEEGSFMAVNDLDRTKTVRDVIVIKDELVDNQISGSSFEDADTARSTCVKEEERSGRQTPVIVKMEVVDDKWQPKTAGSKMNVSLCSVKMEAEVGHLSIHRNIKQPSVKPDPETEIKTGSITPDPETESIVDEGIKGSSDCTSPEENQNGQVPLIGIKNEMTEKLGDPSSSNSNDSFCSMDSDTKSDRALDVMVHFEKCVVKQETEHDKSYSTFSSVSDDVTRDCNWKDESMDSVELGVHHLDQDVEGRGSSVGKGINIVTPHQEDETTTSSTGIKETLKINRDGPIVCSECNRTFSRPCGLKVHMKTHSEVHVCPECNKIFSRMYNLRVHLKQHAGEKPFVCQQCSAAFVTSSQLKVHMRSHTGEKPFSCPECSAAFPTTSALKTHQRTHSELRPYVCGECHATFKQRSSYRAHSRVHNGRKRFSCTDCDSMFFTASQMRAHMRRTHLKERPFSCSEHNCKCVYGTKWQLKVHMRKHTGEKPFPCTVCEAAFVTNNQLKAHMSKHTGKKPYACVECNKTFTTSGHLRIHKRLHSGHKPFVCSECGVAFATSSHLKVHVRKHTGEKPYICPDCGAAYMVSSDLKSHMWSHTTSKGLPCTECKKVFTRKDRLKSHMKTHRVRSPHTCSECSATFTKVWNYKIHLRTHTGEKPFSCTKCPVAFADSSSMKKHMRIHTGEKPYTCSVCGNAYRWSGNLRAHMTSHVRDFEKDMSSYSTQADPPQS